MVSVSFTPMHSDDRPAMDRLLFHSFGPTRRDLPAYALRQGPPHDRLSWVARSAEGQILGCLRFWSVRVAPSGHRSVLLGPLAVDLAYRGAGVARSLIQFGLNQATDQGFELCFVIGEPRLYRRFGFTNAAWSKIQTQAPIPRRRLQVLELRDGILSEISRIQTLQASFSDKYD